MTTDTSDNGAVRYSDLRQCASVDQSDRKVPINLRQSGPTLVGLLISTRVRKSPYWHLSMEAGCWRATVYNRVYHPRGYVRPEDGGAMVEYDALVNHVTLWNVAVERQIQVRGPDAEKFVNHVITRDATRIAPMHAKYVILCNEDGGVLNDPVLLRVADDEFWFSLADSDIEMWLRGVNLGLGLDVSIAEIDVAPVQIQGPKSEALMVDLFGERVRDYPLLRADARASERPRRHRLANGVHRRKGLRDIPQGRHSLRGRPLVRSARSRRTAPAHGHGPGASPPHSRRHPVLGAGPSTRKPCLSSATSATRYRAESRRTMSASGRWKRRGAPSTRAHPRSATCSSASSSAVDR